MKSNPQHGPIRNEQKVANGQAYLHERWSVSHYHGYPAQTESKHSCSMLYIHCSAYSHYRMNMSIVYLVALLPYQS